METIDEVVVARWRQGRHAGDVHRSQPQLEVQVRALGRYHLLESNVERFEDTLDSSTEDGSLDLLEGQKLQSELPESNEDVAALGRSASALCHEFCLVEDWIGKIDHRRSHQRFELAPHGMPIDFETVELGNLDDGLGKFDRRKSHQWSELALCSMPTDFGTVEHGDLDDGFLGGASSEIEEVLNSVCTERREVD